MAGPRSPLPPPPEQRQARCAARTDPDLERGEEPERGPRHDPGQRPSRQAANPQPQHEGGDDDGDRGDVDPVDPEQDALPRELIDESGGSGEQENSVDRDLDGLAGAAGPSL